MLYNDIMVILFVNVPKYGNSRVFYNLSRAYE